MNQFDVYVNEKFSCTILAKSTIHALKKAEMHTWVYNQVKNLRNQRKSVEFVIMNKNNPINCMTSVYTYKPDITDTPKIDSDRMLPGFVYVRVNNDLYRKCLALKRRNEVAYFDGIDFIFTASLDIDFFVDDYGLKIFRTEFPHHFETQFFDTIFEILLEKFNDKSTSK